MHAAASAGERRLPPPEQRVAALLGAVAEAAGAPLTPGMRILDFGAGAGRHVGELRELGYDAWGVDQMFTAHEAGSVEDEFLVRIDPPRYELPFAEGEFDFVYSTTVMEHVTDPDVALAEIARVLRPGGLSIHVFPARWRFVEPHMFVPFGGRLQNYWAMRLWAALGVRNAFQRGMSATEVALSNAQYSKTGINYPSAHEWVLRARPHFSKVGWDEASFIRAARPISRIARFYTPLLRIPGAELAYRSFHMRVLVLMR
jgi:SAM-dependent methyltransferase